MSLAEEVCHMGVESESISPSCTFSLLFLCFQFSVKMWDSCFLLLSWLLSCAAMSACQSAPYPAEMVSQNKGFLLWFALEFYHSKIKVLQHSPCPYHWIDGLSLSRFIVFLSFGWVYFLRLNFQKKNCWIKGCKFLWHIKWNVKPVIITYSSSIF